MENPNVGETAVTVGTMAGVVNPPPGGAGPGEVFAAADGEISFQPATADAKEPHGGRGLVRGHKRFRGPTR